MYRACARLWILLSLILCVATCVLWARSNTSGSTLGYVTSGGNAYMLDIGGGTTIEGQQNWLLLDRYRGHRGWLVQLNWYWSIRKDWRDSLGLRRGAFGVSTSAYGSFPSIHAWLPIGWAAVALSVSPAWYLARLAVRDRKRATHACAACGYDLRATPHRCPECGAEP